jgi:hypothetical protein
MTVSPAMLDEPRGHQALTVVAFDVWAISTKVQRGDLAANVDAWIKSGKPSHPMLARVLAGLREYVARVGQVPSWFPSSLLKVIEGPRNVRRERGGAIARRGLGDTHEDLASYADEERPKRPKTRGDCLDGGSNASRPCPFFSCRHHLGTEINPVNGAIKANFGTVEIDEMPATCSLDLADAGGVELAELPALTGLSYSRAYQAVHEATIRARALSVEIVDAVPWANLKTKG